jgi:4'-phosphopantetheinyl transferase
MSAAAILSSVAPWRSPSELTVLGCDEVHVWQADLDQAPPRIQRFLDDLAEDERARAQRFHFDRDRERFIVARGMLRAILGRYVHRAPGSLCFCYGAHGKPALAEETGADAIHFNVSHSSGTALFAVTRGRKLGIDIERIRSDLAIAGIAQRFFSRREVAMLRALPTESLRQAFFRCWTCKEAYIKGRGDGLSLPLDGFDVSLAPGESAVLSIELDPSEAARWSLRELTAAPGYAAAVAVEGQGSRLACWQWPDRKPYSV